MKIVVLSLMAFLGLNVSTYASEKVTLETLVTCQQDDGDQWVEVGIVMYDGQGLSAFVVKHNSDDDSSTLISAKRVVGQRNGKTAVYRDNYATLKLVVKTKGRRLLGDLLMWPNTVSQKDLFCYNNSTISYDKK